MTKNASVSRGLATMSRTSPKCTASARETGERHPEDRARAPAARERAGIRAEPRPAARLPADGRDESDCGAENRKGQQEMHEPHPDRGRRKHLGRNRVVLRRRGPFDRKVSTGRRRSAEETKPHTSTPPKRKSAYGRTSERAGRTRSERPSRRHEQEQQRVEKGPEEAERAPAVARRELAPHEGGARARCARARRRG